LTKRNPALVAVLSIITFGIYAIVWYVSTKEEMNQNYQADVPTAWLLIVPFVNIYWIWRFCGGVEKTTGQSAPVNFLLLFLLSVIGMAIVQSKLNEVATA
jgi:hypothetical protein